MTFPPPLLFNSIYKSNELLWYVEGAKPGKWIKINMNKTDEEIKEEKKQCGENKRER